MDNTQQTDIPPATTPEAIAEAIGRKDGIALAESIDLHVWIAPDNLPDPLSGEWSEGYTEFDLAIDCGIGEHDLDNHDYVLYLAEIYEDSHWHSYWEELYKRDKLRAMP